MFRKWLVVSGLIGLVCVGAANDREVGFRETFALANDRAVALKKLLPGTDDYFYFHCLHYLNELKFDDYTAMMKRWKLKRKGDHELRAELERRYAVLLFEKDEKKSLALLRKNHEIETEEVLRKVAGKTFPSRLPASALTPAKFAAAGAWRPFSSYPFLLAKRKLTPEQTSELVQILSWPDLPGLMDLVVTDLLAQEAKRKRRELGRIRPDRPNPAFDGIGFGSRHIHSRLTLAQMDELLIRLPALRAQGAFIKGYLIRLRPSADSDWQTDAKEYGDYLDRLWAFVSKLPPAQNSLKAHVLHHRLRLNLKQGRYDRKAFVEYIKLPRSQKYMASKYVASQSELANLDAEFSESTMLSPVGQDKDLVWNHLAHFLATDPDYKEFAKYLAEGFLRRAFATARLQTEKELSQEWHKWLSTDEYRSVTDRVVVAFAPQNPTRFARDADVELKAQLKNVKRLIIRAYKINTLNFLRDRRHDRFDELRLDGLTPNWEEVHEYNQPPRLRFTQSFKLPKLKQAGTYIVELIGNGVRCRAMIRKGGLEGVVTMTDRGPVITVLNEQHQHVKNTQVFVNGRRFDADKNGFVLIPFSSGRTSRTAVLHDGEVSGLLGIDSTAESYRLRAGFYVDRESLFDGRKARVLLRPVLYLGYQPIPLRNLKQVALTVVTVGHNDLTQRHRLAIEELKDDRETIVDFEVPEGLKEIEFKLTAIVVKTNGKELKLHVPRKFTFRDERSDLQIASAELVRAAEGVSIDVLGRNAEPIKGTPLALRFYHKWFTKPVAVTLQTDDRGRITLGRLDNIEVIETKMAGRKYRWDLTGDTQTYPHVLNAVAGQPLVVPVHVTGRRTQREDFAFFETRGDVPVVDRFSDLRLKPGALEIRNLAPGDYGLLIRDTSSYIRIKVSRGEVSTGFLRGGGRMLELPRQKPLVVAAVERARNRLQIRLTGNTSHTRVHVLGTRYHSGLQLMRQLAVYRDAGLLTRGLDPALPQYGEQETLRSEMLYVYMRRYMKKYPGNMLPRTSLILNPYDRDLVRIRQGQRGSPLRLRGLYGGRSNAGRKKAIGKYGAASGGSSYSPPEHRAPAFLGDPTVTWFNLRPDRQGQISIDLTKLKGKHDLRILVVDRGRSIFRTVALPEGKPQFRDRRLSQALDPKKHYVQTQTVKFLGKGEELKVTNARLAELGVCESLPQLYQLYASINPDWRYDEFVFITRWPSLKDDEKRTLYSDHACHELNFFVFKKDPKFFRQVVKPHLQQKKDKQFMDHWLLGDDLTAYADLWRFKKLSLMERLLLGQKMPKHQPAILRHIQDLTAAKSADLIDHDKPFAMGLRRSANIDPREPVFYRYLPTFRTDKVNIQKEEAEIEELEEEVFDDGGAAPRGSFPMAAAPARAVGQYHPLGPPRESAESNFYRHTSPRDHVVVSGYRFWRDLAQHDQTKPFYSTNVLRPTASFTETIFALSLLDLPFQPGKSSVDVKDDVCTLKAGGPLFVFLRKIGETPATRKQVTVADQYFEPSGGRTVVPISGNEFATGKTYGYRVIVSNPTDKPQMVSVLMQIPQGAIPLGKTITTQRRHVALSPYGSEELRCRFYFPRAGSFKHFPAQVSAEGKLLGWADPRKELVAKEKAITVDRKSWHHVARNGSAAEIVAFLKTANIEELDLKMIRPRLHDAALFRGVVEVLRSRFAYEWSIWQYALVHGDKHALREYLSVGTGNYDIAAIGPSIDTVLMVEQPEQTSRYEHLEYSPIVNPRVHQLGPRPRIYNERLFHRYMLLLRTLMFKAKLTSPDRLVLTHFLLVQDRVDDALAQFKQVDPKQIKTTMQFDYMQSYLAMYQEDLRKARSVAEKYRNYPIVHWRKKFTEVLRQLDEIDGKRAVKDPADEDRFDLVAEAPSFNFKLDGGRLMVTYQNLTECTVRCFPMDLELLFSNNPFLRGNLGAGTYIQPQTSFKVKLNKNGKQEIELPRQLQNRNVLVEVEAGGQRQSLARSVAAMDVQIVSAAGQLQVRQANNRKPLKAVYVKVFVQMDNGRVYFYKDGYTDLRGRFNYADHNDDILSRVQRLGILVQSAEFGALVRETMPPNGYSGDSSKLRLPPVTRRLKTAPKSQSTIRWYFEGSAGKSGSQNNEENNEGVWDDDDDDDEDLGFDDDDDDDDEAW